MRALCILMPFVAVALASYAEPKKHEKDNHDHYTYNGMYGGYCEYDGLYYRDEKSFIICSNGNGYDQWCSPGTKNSPYAKYNRGNGYGYRDFCDVNLVDEGYTLIAHRNIHKEKDSHAKDSYEKDSYVEDTHGEKSYTADSHKVESHHKRDHSYVAHHDNDYDRRDRGYPQKYTSYNNYGYGYDRKAFGNNHHGNGYDRKDHGHGQKHGYNRHNNRHDNVYGHGSDYKSLSYDEPKYEAPKYEAPKYEAPKYEAPKYEAPKYKRPKYEKPKYEEPKYEEPKYEEPKYEEPKYEEPKYEALTYRGKYNGYCEYDGIYYRNKNSFIFCSNGNSYEQYCAPGTRNSPYEKFSYGDDYSTRDFCDVNLVDLGYGAGRYTVKKYDIHHGSYH